MAAANVLIVDDDPNILAAYCRGLRKRYKIETAEGGPEGLAAIDAGGPFSVVVSDMQMPGMNGVEFLMQVKDAAPHAVRMMLTGNADQQTAMEAINHGSIFRFVTKPATPEELSEAIDACLAQYRLITAEKELLEKTLAGSVKLLTDVLFSVNTAGTGRTAAVRAWAGALASVLRLQNAWQLNMAAMLASIGEVTLPPDVVARAARGEELTPGERATLDKVPEIGRKLIDNIPRMKAVSDIVHYQAKRFDGGGFPADDVAGEAIPREARILKILQDLHARTGGHAPTEQVLDQMARDAGAYDPDLLRTVKDNIATLVEETPGGTGRGVQELTAGALREGDQLAKDAVLTDGQLVLAADHILTEPVIEKLRNLAKLGSLNEPVSVLR